MSDTWFGIIVGAIISIPISVLAPYVNRALDRRSASKTQARAERDAKFKDLVAQFTRDRNGLYTYVLEALIRIAYIGALFGALSGLLFVIGQFSPMGMVTSFLYGIGQLIGLVGALIVLNISSQAVQVVRGVRSATS